MVSSMTGFGRGEARHNGFVVLVEIRSLNHRFLDIEVRLPKSLNSCEVEIKELIGSQLSRGRVNATITVKGEQAPAASLTLDKPLATIYMKLLQELRQEFDLDGPIELQQLLSFPDIIAAGNSNELDEDVMGLVKSVVQTAITDLKEMRLREGQEIEKDLHDRIQGIQRLLKHIEARTKETSKAVFQKLRERVEALTDLEVLDEGRLELEVAVLAEKADVTEECIRFKSHATLFLELLEKTSSEGRKLNFLLQEMHREANTIGAKANDAQIAHWVVEIKEEVEKLREQVQNIE
ncbi:MAG: YicC/YloC family endoribonuclease [bacterium]